MTETQQTFELVPASGEQEATHQKIRSRRRMIALVSIAIALVVLPTLWAVHLALQLSRSPVSLVRPHDYEASLEHVLELQTLALSEAKANGKTFFVSNIGCAVPPVWQDKRVLENFKRMREAGVKLTLMSGRVGHQGEILPSQYWPYEFREKLRKALGLEQEEIEEFYYILPRELYNHSVVAGSAQRSQAYIASHEDGNIYPTTYFIVTDNEACQEMKRKLLTKVLTPDKPKEDPS